MPLNTLEINTISRGIAACKKLIAELEPEIQTLNIIYDSVGGVKTTITQQNLDLATQYSGLTKSQLDDAFNALTNTTGGIRQILVNSYSALAILASRG